eukprot:GHVT01022654.1.p1 GENE.GHVT01022654.1~~GHVT01022654.1.p1  ORF type:complete len:201 (+),score=7.61 GHVT01022654.1:268-870(+)
MVTSTPAVAVHEGLSPGKGGQGSVHTSTEELVRSDAPVVGRTNPGTRMHPAMTTVEARADIHHQCEGFAGETGPAASGGTRGAASPGVQDDRYGIEVVPASLGQRVPVYTNTGTWHYANEPGTRGLRYPRGLDGEIPVDGQGLTQEYAGHFAESSHLPGPWAGPHGQEGDRYGRSHDGGRQAGGADEYPSYEVDGRRRWL